MKIELPPIKDFGWKMKPIESAATEFQIRDGNVFELTIQHSTIRGVTPSMLYWWFCNIGGTMTYAGKVYPRYQVWHPEDHIHWSLEKPAPQGGAGIGAKFRIVEAFGRDMRQSVNSVETIEKLDPTGICLARKIAGTTVFSLEHWFSPDPKGTNYQSKMVVGASDFPIGQLFTRTIRPFVFSKQMGYSWLKHNVEEVGNFEFFLPELYETENQSIHANGA